MKTNLVAVLATTILLGLGVLAPDAHAKGKCSWTVTSNISPPDKDVVCDAGTSGLFAHWFWSFNYYADQFIMYGSMYADDTFCSTSLSKAASGNGTYTVTRISKCDHPKEDIEAFARNQFKARARLADDNSAACAGHQLIKGATFPLHCESKGGVELTNSALEEGKTSGTVSVTLWNTVSVSINWSMSGSDSLEHVFSDSDGATGGKSPEVITCHTDLDLDVNVSDSNGWTEEGDCSITDPKAELIVWGTCDGECGVVAEVFHARLGY